LIFNPVLSNKTVQF